MLKNWVRPLRLWLAFALAASVLFLACWVFINAPTRSLLPLSVGAPEGSAWLILGSLLAIGLVLANVRTHWSARIALTFAVAALALAATPFARFPATARRFDSATRAAFGNAPPAALSVTELFAGVPPGEWRVDRGVPVTAAGGAPLTMDIYRPARTGTFPVVVQIYGGAWQRGNPGDNAEFAEWLAALGYAVFAIDYRHAPAAHWPAQIDDVRTDLAWIRDHAAAYGADTSFVAILGRSAGAHLAMMAAYTDSPLSIRAVLSYYGPVDLVDAYENPPHPDPLHIRLVEETLFGGTLAEMRSVYAQASPIVQVTRTLPPTLLVYGARDHIVEARYAERLRDKLAATGTPVALLEIPWADHAFDEVFSGPSAQLLRHFTEQFLKHAMAKVERPVP